MKLLKINRTLISFAVVVLLSVLLMTVRCFAYDYSKITGSMATGAYISGYETALQVDVVDFGADPTGKKDSRKAFQKALNYAIDNASDTVQVKVYVPSGKYIINSALEIYSNTWLFLEDDATIYRNYEVGKMLCSSPKISSYGYGGARNIIIEGGCFDGNTTGTTDTSNLRFAHITNLWIKNVDIKNNYNGHHLEIGGAKNVTIENCEFHGYRGSAEKEAIQLDVMHSEGIFQGYAPFDDTSCENIVIKNNKFYDLMRGIGSHSAVVGVYYRNVLIQGNSFDNMTSTAMVLFNYKDTIIEKNTLTNVGYGIDFAYMVENSSGSFFEPLQGYAGITDRLNDNANTIIRDNTISTAKTRYVSSPWAVRIMGRKISGDGRYPDYDFKVEGMKISGNTFNTVAQAVVLNNTKGILINSNTIIGKDDFLDKDLVEISSSKECQVSSNTIKNGTQNCVYITGGSDNIVSENKLLGGGVSGVYISGKSKSCVVKLNTVKNSGSNGIKITGEATADVLENTVKGSVNCGIIFEGASGSALSNISKANGKDGVYAKGSSANIRSNKLLNNKRVGLNVNESSVVTLGSNIYRDNAKGELKISDGGQAKISAPLDFVSDNIYDDNVQLSWSPVTEADGYIIYRKFTTSDSYEEIARVTSASYVDMNLEARTKYDYIVKGYFTYEQKEMIGEDSSVVNIKTKTSIANSSADLDKVVNFTGKRREQVFNIYVDGVPLVKDIDYTVKYSNNLNVGTAYITVTGKGEYCKAKVFSFEIAFLPDDISGVKQAEHVEKTPSLMKYDLFRTNYEYKLVCKDKISVVSEVGISPEMEDAVRAKLADLEDYSGLKISFRSVRKSYDRTINGAWI